MLKVVNQHMARQNTALRVPVQQDMDQREEEAENAVECAKLEGALQQVLVVKKQETFFLWFIS